MTFRPTPADLAQLAEAGIPPAEAERQLALLADPPAPLRLARPCRIGDGIERLEPDRHDELLRRYDEAAAAGRASVFVPASGAASRMFRLLLRARDGDPEARRAVEERLLPHRHELALADDLDAVLVERDSSLREGSRDEILAALLDPDAFDGPSRPKGLIPFHRSSEGPRTAFEEHLAEAADYLRNRDGRCRLHVTVAEGRRADFEAVLERFRAERPGLRFEVDFSEQDPATDTLALDAEGEPFRLDDGRLLLRPGGHGALLLNLSRCDGDVVFVKNIDNIQPARRREQVVRWKRLLGGRLLELEARVHDLLARLANDGTGSEIDEARALLRELRPGFPQPTGTGNELRQGLHAALARPLRVCGVVRNEGEPGGGPFWVSHAEGSSLQIVEAAQVNHQDPAQDRIWEQSTHFNPVDLVLSLRRPDGTPWPLTRFRNDSAVFVATKSHEGRPLRALEHPGLWNGAMADWSTVFVEVPAETFAPVKTLFDLLREAHRS